MVMLPSQVRQWSKKSEVGEINHHYLISRSVWFLIISRRSHRFMRTKSDLEKNNPKINSSSLINQSDSNTEEKRPNFMHPSPCFLAQNPPLQLWKHLYLSRYHHWRFLSTHPPAGTAHISPFVLRWQIELMDSSYSTRKSKPIKQIRKHVHNWTKLEHS